MIRTWKQHVATEDLVTAYRETGSIWKAGKKLGLAGQTVHERLRAIGYPIGSRAWTQEETEELQQLIGNGVPLAEVAHRLARTYAGVACRASRTDTRSTRPRTKKLPRGAGYDKATVGRHLTTLERTKVKVTQYARSEGVNVDSLVYAFQQHYPDRWAAYVATHSPIPSKVCAYCNTEFVPANGKQRYCTRLCGARANADKSYFGGNRRNTIGLAEGVCQLCGRSDAKTLSSHHVLGKENDPLNSELVALCTGCHQIVSHLGGRAFVDDPRAWEALITLAWMRRHGAEIHASQNPKTLYAEVLIEEWDDDDDQTGMTEEDQRWIAAEVHEHAEKIDWRAVALKLATASHPDFSRLSTREAGWIQAEVDHIREGQWGIGHERTADAAERGTA